MRASGRTTSKHAPYSTEPVTFALQVFRRCVDAARGHKRWLVISERLLGTTEIVVIHHTDCGMLTFTNADLAQKIHHDLEVDVGDRDFLPFPDVAQSVRDDVARLRASPLIPKDISIAGAVYDVRTGTVQELVRA